MFFFIPPGTQTSVCLSVGLTSANAQSPLVLFVLNLLLYSKSITNPTNEVRAEKRAQTELMLVHNPRQHSCTLSLQKISSEWMRNIVLIVIFPCPLAA